MIPYSFSNLICPPPKDTSTIFYGTQFGSFTSNFRGCTSYAIKILDSQLRYSYFDNCRFVHTRYNRWTKTKTTERNLNHYHKQISSIYNIGKLEKNDIKSLDKLKKILHMHILKAK